MWGVGGGGRGKYGTDRWTALFSACTMIMEWRFRWCPLQAADRKHYQSFSVRLSQFYPCVLIFGLLLLLKSYFTSVIYYFDISNDFKEIFCQCKLTLLYLNRNTHSKLTGNATMLHRKPIHMLSAVTSINPSTSGTCRKLRPQKFKLAISWKTTFKVQLDTIKFIWYKKLLINAHSLYSCFNFYCFK